jgi:hypothetical protein
MTNEIARQQKVLVLRNGLEIWIDKDKAEEIENDWVNGNLKGAFKIEGRTLNTSDLSAIVKPLDMEELRRRKNGQWKCRFGVFHDRGEKCSCEVDLENKRNIERTRIMLDELKNK